MIVPRLDLGVADRALRDEIDRAIRSVVDSGRMIDGPEVAAFEREAGDYLGTNVVAVASGTDALALSLEVLGSGIKRLRVGIPAFTFSATASAVYRAGMTPVLVDIDDETMTLDWAQALDGPLLHVVVPVHLYGYVCEIPGADLEDSFVLEDACQAFGGSFADGRKAGTLGDAAAFSFFPSKPLGAYGDGGAVAMRLAPRAQNVRRLARHGARARYVSERIGFNSRLDAIQAAILRVKLRATDAARTERTRIAAWYDAALGALERPWLRLPPRSSGHTWHCYVIRVPAYAREGLLAHLRGAGVDAVVQYPLGLHRQPAFAEAQRRGSLHVTDRCAAQVIGLPIWAGMSDDQLEHVRRALQSAQI